MEGLASRPGPTRDGIFTQPDFSGAQIKTCLELFDVIVVTDSLAGGEYAKLANGTWNVQHELCEVDELGRGKSGRDIGAEPSTHMASHGLADLH